MSAARRVRSAPRRFVGGRLLPRVDRGDWYRARWSAAGAAAGLDIAELDDGWLQVGRIRVRGNVTSIDAPETARLAGDKDAVKHRLTTVGLVVPETVWVSERRVAVPPLRLGRERGLVVKPLRATGGGEGVTVDPPTVRLFVRAVAEAAAVGRGPVTIERMTPGRIVRVLVADGEVLDSVERTPAVVLGDGEATVAELIATENERRSGLGAHTTGLVPVTSDCRAALGRQGIALDSVAAAGRHVVVAGRSNTGSERESHRVTLPERAVEIAVSAAEAIDGRLIGVDLVLDDARRVVAVLEVNTYPGLHWHMLVAGPPMPVFDAVVERFAR